MDSIYNQDYIVWLRPDGTVKFFPSQDNLQRKLYEEGLSTQDLLNEGNLFIKSWDYHNSEFRNGIWRWRNNKEEITPQESLYSNL